jgi:hypothetical protein
LNSPTIQSGIAPPHGFALSSLRSNRTVSIERSCAKISAAQAPDGPPPTTATLYFMQRAEEVSMFDTILDDPKKEELENDVTVVVLAASVNNKSFILDDYQIEYVGGSAFDENKICTKNWSFGPTIDLPT